MAYQGLTVTLPIGKHGFTGSRNPSQMMPSHLPYVEGLSLDGGILQKDGGATKLNASAIGGETRRVVAGISWAATGEDRFDYVMLDDGRVFRGSAGTFPTTLVNATAPPNNHSPVFVPGGGEDVGSPQRLFLFSANNQVQVVSGTGDTMADISGPVSDWAGAGNFPTFGVVHGNRLWAGGNRSDPHRIYLSAIGTHQDFSTNVFTLPVYPGIGEKLVGGISFRDRLVLFKYPRGIFIIDTSDPTSANWRTFLLTDAVGTLNQHTIVPIDNDVLYMDAGGNIHLLSATNDLGGINTSNLSQIHDLGPFVRREVNFSRIQNAQGMYYAAKRKAWFAIPRVGSEYPDMRIEVDFNDPQVGPRFLLSRRDDLSALWMRPDNLNIPRPTFGSYGGQVWLADQDGKDKDGDGYTMRFETADTDLSFASPELAFKSKTAQFIEVTFEPAGNWDVVFSVIWDGIDTQSIPINMRDPSGAELGSFVLGTDGLGVDGIITIREKMVGSGRRMRLIMENSVAGQDIAISDISIGFVVADERVKS